MDARLSEIKIRLDSAGASPTWSLSPDLRPPAAVLWCDAKTRITKLHNIWAATRQWTDPLKALAWLQQAANESIWPDARWVGYLSYDLGRLFEPALPQLGSTDLPLFIFTLHSSHEYHLPPTSDSRHAKSNAPLTSNFTRPQYESAVARAIDYIRAGDVFQVNLSQRFTAGVSASPQEIYQRLLDHSPAAYGALLDYGEFALVSNSPELFFRVTPDRRIITRPIKGTRPKAPGMDIELRDSVKDQAELNMIVDLERNDLGRICEIGSVKVAQPRAIESHPTLYHGVATIEGHLRPAVSFVDLLRATFPGGSVTGAPKIRAMQIIDELEPHPRGPYCGAIGYLAADGSMEFNLAIRTMTLQAGLAHIPVGGGIVADSNPAAEYEETLVKAAAMFQSIGIST